MEKVVVQVEMAKSIDDVLKAVEKIVVESKKALADGFQVGADVPALVASCAGDLLAAISASQHISADWAEDSAACEKALALHLVAMKAALLPKA